MIFTPELILFVYSLIAKKLFFNKPHNTVFVFFTAAIVSLMSIDSVMKNYFFTINQYGLSLKTLILFCTTAIAYYLDINKQITLIMSTIGIIFTIYASNFIALIIALEIVTTAVYIALNLNIIDKSKKKIFFLTHILSSIFIMTGATYLCCVFSTVLLSDLGYFIMYSPYTPIAQHIAAITMLLGFAMKLGIGFFHYWVIDESFNNSTDTAGVVCITLKLAVTIAFIKVANNIFINFHYTSFVCIISCLSMLFSSIAISFETNLKRIIALCYTYTSAIVFLYAGFENHSLLKGVLAIIIGETLFILGIIMITKTIKRAYNKELETIYDYSGLCLYHPFLSISITVLFLSICGLLPTIGFFSKIYTCLACIESYKIIVSTIFIISNLIFSICFIRIVAKIWFASAEKTNFFIENVKNIQYIHYLAVSLFIVTIIINQLSMSAL